MPKQRISKTVALNRAMLDEMVLGYADGLQAVGERIIEGSQPPDAPPYGKGLIKGGRVATFLLGKRVAGSGSPPRGSVLQRGVTTIVGFLFPGRFNEEGTIHQPARPFLTPSFMAEIPDAPATVAPAIQARIDRVRD